MTLETMAPLSDDPIVKLPPWPPDNPAGPRRRAKHRCSYTIPWDTIGLRTARPAFQGYLERLRTFRVLDPACGSGNFLYLALLAFKDLEHRANIETEVIGLERVASAIGPECVLGIEINPYAAELARVTVWIGEIQWMRRNGFDVSRYPILKPLETIECRDAILNQDGTAAEWPEAGRNHWKPAILR